MQFYKPGEKLPEIPTKAPSDCEAPYVADTLKCLALLYAVGFGWLAVLSGLYYLFMGLAGGQ